LAGLRWSWPGSKKNSPATTEAKRALVEPAHPHLSVRRQCELLGLSRSAWYYEPAVESVQNLRLMNLIDREYTRHPTMGRRRMTQWLRSKGQAVNEKRVRRLMQVMGLEAIYPKPRLSVRCPQHRVFPYLLRGVSIERVDQVWSTDITYVPMPTGFMYLAAVVDWYSRYVLGWRLSNTLDGTFCADLLDDVLRRRRPEVFNTDQGVQFTAQAFVSRLERAEVRISMDGRGRALDNVFVERLWRSVKYENVYLCDYETPRAAERGLAAYFRFYNELRPHQSLAYRTPAEAYGCGVENKQNLGAKNSGCARLREESR
jgi:putative transposase